MCAMEFGFSGINGAVVGEKVHPCHRVWAMETLTFHRYVRVLGGARMMEFTTPDAAR